MKLFSGPWPALFFWCHGLCAAFSVNCAGQTGTGAVAGEASSTNASACALKSFTIPAYAFDRGNAAVFTDRWADGEAMIAFGGQSPITAHYDIPFPVDGRYTLFVLYAAAGAREVKLLLDDMPAGSCCRTANGSWNTSRAQWENAGALDLKAGKHTITLLREGAFPHIVALRFESTTAFPAGWALVRPGAKTLADGVRQKRATGVGAKIEIPRWVPYKPSGVNIGALRMAITDLMSTFGSGYRGGDYLRRLDALAKARRQLDGTADDGAPAARKKIDAELVALQGEALLANPLLKIERLLLVKRHNRAPSLGLPRNWQSNSSLPKHGFDDEIVVLSPVLPDGRIETLFKPAAGRFVGDVDLNFDGKKLLFSMLGDNGRWQVFEMGADGSGPRQLTGQEPDVDSYDGCYLPSGDVLFTSTACFTGVPCVYGSSHVANLFRMDADGGNIRRLTVDQEHDWCPTVLNNGRVLYARWEYIDTPHSNTRLLFHMNPDGTGQMEYIGSNSYWPNSFFYARPIPGHPTKVVSVIGGHHDNPRMGELVVFDPALGRSEAGGAVQRIPGFGKRVEPIIRDGLTLASWPKFLHPFPLSDKYFLVSCKPDPGSLWGLYLVDVFDNIVPIKQLADHALLEPVPLRPSPVPPVVPDKVDLRRSDAVVYIPDIYRGEGMRGVPRGAVKSLRIFTYHFAYEGMGGLLGVIGMEGPWDIRRIIGTVPVHADGSALFRIPALTPISMQPLDDEGKAIQLMRSWMTAMPGETVQCAGCHEPQSSAPPGIAGTALAAPPAEIRPWYGPTRGFSYPREVQPVIDTYCVGCHNGQPYKDGSTPCDFRGTAKISDFKMTTPGNGGAHAGKFSVGYAELHRFVRRPGIESDYHVLGPMEFHADTTQLMQMLNRGHYNVRLDPEAKDRLVTWIDMNCPYHGTWGEELAKPGPQVARRRELLKRYANVDDDPEAVPAPAAGIAAPILPEPLSEKGPASIACPGWPFDEAEGRRRQASAGAATHRVIDLGNGAKIELVLIPAGEFVMGDARGEMDQRPMGRVPITRAFWMAKYEITNLVYGRFNPAHDSRLEDKNTYQFGVRGYPCNLPEQPVVRVSWADAKDFCRWLSERTGERFSLPTEAQWEYACRAGTATPFAHGGTGDDFSAFANLADAKLTEFASDPYTVDRPLKNPTKYEDWIPKDARFNDGALVAVAPGRYRPNAWGLFDMHGNVAEWTDTAYRNYPYCATDGRDRGDAAGRKVVRGGSWRDQPADSTSGARTSYLPWQRVFNVGFRVVADAQQSLVKK